MIINPVNKSTNMKTLIEKVENLVEIFSQISWKAFKAAYRNLYKMFHLTHRLKVFVIKYGDVVGCATITLTPLEV